MCEKNIFPHYPFYVDLICMPSPEGRKTLFFPLTRIQLRVHDDQIYACSKFMYYIFNDSQFSAPFMFFSFPFSTCHCGYVHFCKQKYYIFYTYQLEYILGKLTPRKLHMKAVEKLCYCGELVVTPAVWVVIMYKVLVRVESFLSLQFPISFMLSLQTLMLLTLRTQRKFSHHFHITTRPGQPTSCFSLLSPFFPIGSWKRAMCCVVVALLRQRIGVGMGSGVRVQLKKTAKHYIVAQGLFH